MDHQVDMVELEVDISVPVAFVVDEDGETTSVPLETDPELVCRLTDVPLAP